MWEGLGMCGGLGGVPHANLRGSIPREYSGTDHFKHPCGCLSVIDKLNTELILSKRRLVSGGECSAGAC